MVSILTLVHGRREHLANVLAGIEKSGVKPDEFVIVHMNETPVRYSSPFFDVCNVLVTDENRLPLAKARNAAVANARGEHLIFLDVDCIPDAGLLASYIASLNTRPDAVLQGEVRYLPAETDASVCSSAMLADVAVPHPLHHFRQRDTQLPYNLFWSLNFACTRTVFDRIGGFDPAYEGYGGEDTDFSFRARHKEIPVFPADALAFHQYHTVCEPPLNHFADIVRNAMIFRKIWGEWPMEGWLNAFQEMGFIRRNRFEIEILTLPTARDIANCSNAEGAVF